MLDRLLKDPQFLPEVFETMRDGLMLMDADGNIQFLNKATEEIRGYSREEVLGKPCTILDSDTCVSLTESGKKKDCSIFKLGSICNKKCQIKSTDGRPVYLLKNAAVLKDDNGETIGAVESMTDITSLYLKEMELQGLKQEFMGLLAKSTPMQRLYEHIRNAAQTGV